MIGTAVQAGISGNPEKGKRGFCMSNEWNWNDPEKHSDGPAEDKGSVGEAADGGQEKADVGGEAAAAREGSFDTAEEPADTQNMAAEKKAEGQGGDSAQRQEDGAETYHWVNPRMRKPGGSESNTYTASDYREDVGGKSDSASSFGDRQTEREQGPQAQTGSSRDTGHGWQPQNGYTQNTGTGQKTWNSGVSPTGQRRYGTYQMGQEHPPAKKKEKHPMGYGRKFLLTAGLAVVFGVVAGGIMFGVNYLGNELTGANRQVEVPSTATADQAQDSSAGADTASLPAGTFSVAQVAENAMPSVVSITNASVQTVQDFFGGVQEYPIQSAGSGIIVGQNDEELLIATNNHVVEGAQTLTVSFSDASSYEAQIKGNDAGNDLAVIAVKISDLSSETLSAIKVISLGDSDSLVIGEQVVAIGNALGYGQSVTSGWVSALNRDMTDEDGNVSEDLIQTDAAINPGNSGGALLNMNGELIGINVAKSSGNAVEGMGYAIPIAKAEPVLDSLMSRETRFKVDEEQAAYIGVTCLNVDSGVTEMYGIPEGAFVDSVEEGGPAQQAGIQANDVITEFDGIPIAGSQELVDRLEYYEAGETVDVVYARAENGQYQEHTVSVTLGRRSEMTQEDPAANR